MLTENRFDNLEDGLALYMKSQEASKKLNGIFNFPMFRARFDILGGTIYIQDYFETGGFERFRRITLNDLISNE